MEKPSTYYPTKVIFGKSGQIEFIFIIFSVWSRRRKELKYPRVSSESYSSITEIFFFFLEWEGKTNLEFHLILSCSSEDILSQKETTTNASSFLLETDLCQGVVKGKPVLQPTLGPCHKNIKTPVHGLTDSRWVYLSTATLLIVI